MSNYEVDAPLDSTGCQLVGLLRNCCDDDLPVDNSAAMLTIRHTT